MKIIVQYLFKNMAADMLYINLQTWNTRAIKCYTKAGFTQIKTLEKREIHNGEYKDSLIMQLSKESYQNMHNKSYNIPFIFPKI